MKRVEPSAYCSLLHLLTGLGGQVGLVPLSAAHILGKGSRRFCLQFSWNEAEFALTHLCVCVCVSHPSVTTGLICVTAGGQSSAEAGAHCCLCPCPLGRYVNVNLGSGPVRSVLSPPGLSVPDALNLGGCFWYLFRVEDLGCTCLLSPLLWGITNCGQCYITTSGSNPEGCFWALSSVSSHLSLCWP